MKSVLLTRNTQVPSLYCDPNTKHRVLPRRLEPVAREPLFGSFFSYWVYTFFKTIQIRIIPCAPASTHVFAEAQGTCSSKERPFRPSFPDLWAFRQLLPSLGAEISFLNPLSGRARHRLKADTNGIGSAFWFRNSLAAPKKTPFRRDISFSITYQN